MTRASQLWLVLLLAASGACVRPASEPPATAHDAAVDAAMDPESDAAAAAAARDAHAPDVDAATTERDAGVNERDDASAASAKDAATPLPGYWDELARPLGTTPTGHAVAIVCHNCYRGTLATPAQNLSATLTRLHDAQANDADVLEIDVLDEAGVWRVGHTDDGKGNGALLADVLADQAVIDGNQPIFMEIKEDTAPVEARLRALLTLLQDAGVASEGRWLALRAYHTRDAHLKVLQALLAEDAFSKLAKLLRVHVLFVKDDAAQLELVEDALAQGFAAVEIDYHSAGLEATLARAQKRGLGTGTWTLGGPETQALCAAQRDIADMLVTDDVTVCRAGIEQP